jgi:integrase
LTPLDGSRLRPKSRAFLIWDTQERGLALQVQPSGHKSYKFIFHHRASGKSKWITIGNVDVVSLTEARQEATRLRLEVHHGKDPAARTSTATSTFGAISARYLQEHAMKRNKSWKQAAHLIDRHVLPHWPDRDASSITRSDVRAMLAPITGPILQNQILASTSAIFTWAIRQEILANNPCRSIERNSTTSRERVLSDAEVPLFWNAFASAGIPGLALKVLLLTGQRPGEVAHMRFEHIEDGWWTLPGQPIPALRWPGTKNAQTHRVFLPARVQNIIAEQVYLKSIPVSGFVFGSPPALDLAMREICKALSVPRCTPHDLRRSHGTTITGLGFGRETMNRLQNHKEGGIADVYDRHQYSEENMRVMEAVASRIIALAEGTTTATNVVSIHA